MQHKHTVNVSLRSFLPLILLFGFSTGLIAQDSADWDSLGRLTTNDKVRVSFKDGRHLGGPFENWTAQQITVGGVSGNKAEVLKVERYRQGGWGRGKTAAVGALIGFGAGAGIAAATSRCKSSASNGQLVPNFCGFLVSRGAAIGIGGGVGALIGAGIGAALPHRKKELIYAAPTAAVHR